MSVVKIVVRHSQVIIVVVKLYKIKDYTNCIADLICIFKVLCKKIIEKHTKNSDISAQSTITQLRQKQFINNVFRSMCKKMRY